MAGQTYESTIEAAARNTVTEAEATEERACPVRAPVVQGGSVRCIGKRCMAWRWWAGDDTKGFCGLAGGPLP